MPRYFSNQDGHRLFDASGFVCEDDTDAIIRATVLAISVSLDTPEDDPERRIAIINDAGHEIGNVPVYPGLHTKIRPNRAKCHYVITFDLCSSRVMKRSPLQSSMALLSASRLALPIASSSSAHVNDPYPSKLPSDNAYARYCVMCRLP